MAQEKVKSLVLVAPDRQHMDYKEAVLQYNLQSPTWKQLVGVGEMEEEHTENGCNLHQFASVCFGP